MPITNHLGSLALSQRKVPEAIREYATTGELIPERRNNQGIDHPKSGQFSAAVREFNRALLLDPQNANAQKNPSEAVRHAARQRNSTHGR
jgi:Flp pilus assembly protein TadD